MEWKIQTQNGKTSSSVEVGSFRLSIHHYVGCGETWFLSCAGIFNMLELGDVSLNDAQVIAAAKMQLKLKEAIKIITG